MAQPEIQTSLATAFWVPLFLTYVRECGVVSVAARKAGVALSAVYAKRRIDKGFDDAVSAALGESVDEIEHEARSRAMQGSDKLIIEFLRAKKPDEFRRAEASSSTSVTVNVDTLGLLERLQEKRLAKAPAGPAAARDITPASAELKSE